MAHSIITNRPRLQSSSGSTEAETSSDLKAKPESDLSETLRNLISTAVSYETDALNCLRTATESKEVELLRVAFLGKNGKITGMMKEMRLLSTAEKPRLGEVINRAKDLIETAVIENKKRVTELEYKQKMEQEGLGNLYQIPGVPEFFPEPGRRHPISLVLDLATSIFEDIGYEVIEGPENSPEIENDFFNFQALGMPPDHPARDMQDTFYINTTGLNISDTLLLRTHTSAVQIREMEKRTPPFKLVAPGRVYRKDDVDATHFPVFHQVTEFLSLSLVRSTHIHILRDE